MNKIQCIQGVSNCGPILEGSCMDRACTHSSVPWVQAGSFHHPSTLLGVQDLTALGLTGTLSCSRGSNRRTVSKNPRAVFPICPSYHSLGLVPVPQSWPSLGDQKQNSRCFRPARWGYITLTDVPQISVAYHSKSLFLPYAKSSADTPPHTASQERPPQVLPIP